MFKFLLGILVWIQIIAGELFIWTLSFLFIFEINKFDIAPQYFGILIIIILVSQIILGIAVFIDFRQRKWINDIKGDLWKKIFLYGFFNYGYAMAIIIYYLAIIRDNMPSSWWDEKRKKSFLFQILSRKTVLDFMSKFSAAYIQLFFGIFVLIIIGFTLRSDRLFLLGFKLMGIWFISITTIAGLFIFLIMIHMISKEWTDYSFEEFFTKRMFFFPGLELKNYYYEIVRKELEGNG